MTPRKRNAGVTQSSTACTQLALSASRTLPLRPSREPFANHLPKAGQLTTDGVLEIAGRSGHSPVTVSTLRSQFMN